MKKIKSFVMILAICGLILSFNGNITTAKVRANPKIKIGALGPLAITPGEDMENGAKLAVKKINDAGGVTVDGTTYDLELVVRTTSAGSLGLPDTTTAVTNVKKLIDDDDVTGMLGMFRTEVTVAVELELDRPFLGIGSTAPIITEYFWRVGPSNGTQLVRSLLDFYACGLGLEMGVRNVTIVREQAAWSLAMAGPIRGFLTGTADACLPAYGISCMDLYTSLYGAALGTRTLPKMNFTDDIVIAEGADLDTVTAALTPLQSDLDGLNVNAIMTIFSGPAGKHITEAWASLNLPQYLAGINVEAQKSTHFEDTEGAAYGEIDLETCPPDMEPTNKTKAMREDYSEEYDEQPTYTAFNAYDAVYVLVDAIERADSLEAADIQTALSTTFYTGSAYVIKFTNEVGPQLGVLEDGTKGPVEGVDYTTPIIAHDLYTHGTFMKSGYPYTAGYYAQWQQNGTKKSVWGLETDIGVRTAVGELADKIEWPIDHAEHGYTKPAPTPGFGLPLAIFVLGFLIVMVHNRKRKKI